MGKISKLHKSKKHKKLKNVDTDVPRDSKRGKNFNLAPKNQEEKMPRKIQSIMRFKGKTSKQLQKEKMKQKNKFKKGFKEFHMERGQTRPISAPPKFVQGKCEKSQDFLRRIELESRRVLMKHQLSEKFKIDMDALEGGEIKKDKKKMSDQQKERLKQKKKRRLEKKQKKKDDFSDFRDEVQFGEVVDQPPALTAKPRKATAQDSVQKPGKKSLLLKEIVANNVSVTPSCSGYSAKREIGKSVKRKHLSMAQQSVMDKERQNAIFLYRQMKDKKIKTS